MNGKTTKDLMALMGKKEPSEILQMATSPQEAGHIFEGMCFGLITIGYSPFGAVQMLDGTANKKHGLYPYKSVAEAFERKVKQGGGSGYSDISFKTDKVTYLTTCKWIRDDSDLDDYEITKLHAAAATNKLGADGSVDYVVCCKSRGVFLRTLRASHSKREMQNIKEENILDLDTLSEYARKFRKTLHEKFNGDLDALCGVSFARTPLDLWFHQQLTLAKTLPLLMDDQKDEPVLWALKCRSGKSYIMAGLIAERMRVAPKSSFMVLSSFPNETFHEFSGMFKKYTEFHDIHVMQLKAKTVGRIDPRKRYIFLSSRQFLQGKDIPVLSAMDIDTTFFDEVHMGGSTWNSREILRKYARGFKVFLTATYQRPEYMWDIKESRKLQWDMIDEQLCKENAIDALVERHGELVRQIAVDLPANYQTCPRMKILSHYMNPDAVREIRGNAEMDNYSMDMSQLFACSKESGFRNEGRVQMLLKQIFNPFGRSIKNRIHELAVQSGSRMQGFNTQLWFVPFGSKTTSVDNVSPALKKLLARDTYGKDYHVIVLSSKLESKAKKEIAVYIKQEEEIAKQQGKKGMIILSGKMGSTGVTLDNVDIVFLLNDEKAVDSIFQRMFRCMTEVRDGRKPYGLVVDFNPSRVIRSVLTYADSVQQQGGGKKSSRDTLRNLGNVIDFEDALEARSRDEILDKMMELWAKDVRGRYDYMMDFLSGVSADLMTQEDIQEWKECVGRIKTISKEYQVNGDEEQLSDNSDAESVSSRSSKASSTVTEAKEAPRVLEILSKEMIPSIVHLAAILTSDNVHEVDILRILERIQDTPMLKAVFLSQVECWWGDKIRHKERLLVMIYNLFRFYIKDTSRITVGIEMIKQTFSNMLENKKELLVFLNSILKPKDAEKKKYGEVFTPLETVEEMLDTLPAEVWSNPSLTWFDPAVGSGNFMVCVYYRLMEGLNSAIMDPVERQKHIVENMLYMSELNSKNVLICRRIFGENANIHEGDSLVYEPGRNFDVVVGNPPYNTELKSTGASPLYHKFIEKYIDSCKWLLFIVPSRWFSGGKGLDKFRNSMLQRSDIKLIQNYKNASEVFGREVSIEGGVNYFLKEAGFSGKCMLNGEPVTLGATDILLSDRYVSIVRKIEGYTNLSGIYKSQDHYKIQTNDPRLEAEPSAERILCYVSKQKGFQKYIPKQEIKRGYGSYKVITARANGNRQCFGNIFIGKPNEVHTKSYISFNVGSLAEAEALVSYLKTRFANFLLSLRKCSQDISDSTCKWIPLPPLDRKWTDKELCKYYKLSDSEMDVVMTTPIVGFK